MILLFGILGCSSSRYHPWSCCRNATSIILPWGRNVLKTLFFHKYTKRAAQITVIWRCDGNCNDQKLDNIYNSVKDMFDFDTVSKRRRNYKQFVQQILKMIYCKWNKTITNWLGEKKNSNGFQGLDHLMRSFNYLIHKYWIHLCWAGSLVWVIDTPNNLGGNRENLRTPPHSLHNNFPFSGEYFNLKIEDFYFRHNNACSSISFWLFICENGGSESTLSLYVFWSFSSLLS